MIVSFYCWAACLLLHTFDKNSNRPIFIIYFSHAIYGLFSNVTTLLLGQLILGNLICQYGWCNCYFEELEGRSGLLPVCLCSTRFWRVKARQKWSILIEEVGNLGKNTSMPCDVPWKRLCCSRAFPYTFLLHSSYETLWWKMLFLWRKSMRYVAVVDSEAIWLNHKLSSSAPSSCICCHICCGIDTARSTGFSTLRNKQILLRKYWVTK